MFRLNGKPYDLSRHFAMEPMFMTPLPDMLVIASGRQVSKTTVISARQIAIATNVPNLDFLTVTPLFEQIRNISSNVVARFIDESPLKNRWLGPRPLRNVLQRGFANGSNLYFSYAGTSADRVRGKSIDIINYDEAQDIDYSLISVVNETMSASEAWESVAYTGTHKTLTTPLQHAWDHSSQARWMIRCHQGGCGYVNRCDENHLIKMLGDYRADISESRPGIVCSKCRRFVLPHRGWWEHAYPSRRLRRPGYHIPQVIMPMHYGSPKKWRSLLYKFAGKQGFTEGRFRNEVLGLAFDRSQSLVSQSDLRAASVIPWDGRDEESALNSIDQYEMIVLTVDWSGGGSLTMEKDADKAVYSMTAFAVQGYRVDTGTVETIYGGKLVVGSDSFSEARFLLGIYNKFQCDRFVHDYTGAGNQREQIMMNLGLPPDKIWPVRFAMATKGPAVKVMHGTVNGVARVVWQVDKPRVVQLVCAAIKSKKLLFFKNDYKSEDDRGVIADFLALVEYKIQTMRAGETYTIRRDPKRSDDFAMAVTMGAVGIWHMLQVWPQFGIDIFDSFGDLADDAAEYEAVLAEIGDSIRD